MRKVLFFTLLFFAAVMASMPAAIAAEGGKTLVFALGAEPVSLDPPNQTDNPSEMVVRSVYDNLVDFNEKSEIVPMLAKSWNVSPDGLIYTFNLNKGIKFHDGTPCDAEAVAYNIRRNTNPDKRTKRTPLYEPFIKEVKVLDGNTVQLIMKAPFGALLHHFAHGAGGIVSPAALEKYGDKISLNPVGSGPFKFVEWVPGDRVVLARNDTYWKFKPKVEKIVFKAVPEAASRVIMLETGDADVVYPIPINEVERLNKSKTVKVLTGDTARVMYVAMNTQKKPFDDIRVRQAINYAVDKESICKNILYGQAKPSKSILGSLVWGYAPVDCYAYNPDKAKKLLAEAGYPDGFETSLWTPDGRYPMDAQIAEAIVGMLKKVGIKATLRKWEWASYLSSTRKKLEESTHEMVFFGWAPSTGDADWGIRPLFDTKSWVPAGENRAYYSNPEVDKGIEAGMTTADSAKRKTFYADVQKKIVNDAPWIILHDMTTSVGISNKIKNVILWPIELVILREAYFE